MAEVSGSLRRAMVTSRPESPGIMTSRTTRSGRCFTAQVQAGGAIVGGDDFVAISLQIHGDEFDEIAFIIDDENFLSACHIFS